MESQTLQPKDSKPSTASESNSVVAPNTIPEDMKLTTILGNVFIVDKHYDLSAIIGSGAYGIVAKGINRLTGKPLAVKKVSDIFYNLIDAKRILRELHILKFLCHKNVISLLEVVRIDDVKTFNEVYLVMELMQSNLANVIKSKMVLTQDHIRFLIYQILNGLSFMHSASILHRDMKPENIFVNKKCELKIGDLNMARKIEQDQQQTYYVTTRWYRAPEVLLSSAMYTKAVDIWSAGCILAELIGRVPLFKGGDYMDQFLAIVAVMGKPKPEDFQNDPDVTYNLSRLVTYIPARDKINFKELFPKADDQCLDLLDHMLEYNPKKRYTVEECLNHPYLEKFRKNEREKCTGNFDFTFDKIEVNQDNLREQIYQFVCEFRKQHQLKSEAVVPQIKSASEFGQTEPGFKRPRPYSTIDDQDKGPTKLLKPDPFKTQTAKTDAVKTDT